jgi:hypothetical protein
VSAQPVPAQSVVALPPAPPAVEEVEVELVTVPQPPAPEPTPAAPPERPIWPPDRRDWLMLATGAGAVLSAVGLGYGLARLLRKKEPDEDKP